MIKVLIERDIAEGLEVPYEEVARPRAVGGHPVAWVHLG